MKWIDKGNKELPMSTGNSAFGQSSIGDSVEKKNRSKFVLQPMAS